MKIAIIGYGKMGKMIEKAAREKGHTIAAIVDPLFSGAESPGSAAYKSIEESGSLSNADAAIEFTVPATAIANIKALVRLKIPAVVGTTGWYDNLDEVKKTVEETGSSLLWSSNFSMGVNIFYRIAWHAVQLINSFPEYDIGGFETHHNKKLDSPSGTARTLVEGVLSRSERKKEAVWETLNRAPQPQELHYPSLRVGAAPGAHNLIFDSAADTIEITHTARSREGFASGAVCAAEWLLGRPKGIYTIDDMLKDMLG
jgi:4-hydroxy-tetrahydrodipicolinate reductase